MKLIFAVVRDEDAKHAVKELNKSEFGVTKLSSSGEIGRASCRERVSSPV